MIIDILIICIYKFKDPMMTTTQQSLLKISLISGAIVSSIALTACSSGSSGSSGGSTKTAQTITFSAPMTLGVTETAELNATASSKLAVAYTSTTPEVCSVSEKTVLAKAVGNCTIVAKQAGDSSFKPAEDISVTFAVVPLAVAINADDVSFGKAGKVLLSGKQVSKTLKATLAGADIPVTSTGDYMAEITVTPEMVGDLPLVIKEGDKVIYDDVIKVPLPEATGDSFTVKKTGATKCGNLTENNIDCSDQDKLGEFYQTNQDGEVQAGFDPAYIKVAHQVQKDGKKSMEYCIYDRATGLMWEQKTDDGGLRDKDWLYSWYDSNPDTNGGSVGEPIPVYVEDVFDDCNNTLAKCNSEAYINKLNEMKYCGYSDWKLPRAESLWGLYDFGKTEAPYIDDIFQPIAMVEDPEAYHTHINGIYMSRSSRPAPQSILDLGYQNFMVVPFSDLYYNRFIGYKKQGTFNIIAVRND